MVSWGQKFYYVSEQNFTFTLPSLDEMKEKEKKSFDLRGVLSTLCILIKR